MLINMLMLTNISKEVLELL